MKNILTLLVVAVILGGCETAELAPRTNPRFSVAYIQEIDDTGAQFASNIYDFGSEEILEYGFLYSNQGLPRFGNSEVIRQGGKPDKHFVLKGEHSMVKGRTYQVVAFLQTSSGMVFSAPQSFVSQGAAGFIFEKIAFKEPVFFGDTITVYGSNFSNNSSNYTVTFQQREAKVIDVQKDSFKFIIPEFYDFTTYGPHQDIFQLSIQILDKKAEMNLPIPFKNAEFDDLEIQRIDYGGTIEISGKYLNDLNLKVIVVPQSPEWIYNSNVTILSADQHRIVFRPDPKYVGLENFVTIEIRGKQYNLGRAVFEYNPTEINPGQHVKIAFDDYFTIKGRNFNVEAPHIHLAVINGQAFGVNPEASDSETLTLRLWRQGFNFSRINEFKIETNNKTSLNAATIEFTDPDIPFLKNTIPSMPFSNFLRNGNMTGFEGKGFALGNKEIFEIDIANKRVNPVRALQIATNSLRFTFSVAHGDNWYIGGGRTSNHNPFNRAFYVFNLRSKEIRRLPDLPLNQFRPQLAHVANDQLYLEGGFEPETGEDHGLRYKFDLATEKWTQLPDKVQKRGIVGRTIPFRYKGRYLAYGIPNEYGDDPSGLYEFDVSSDSWNLIQRYYQVGRVGVKTDEVFLLGNKAILVGNGIFVLDLETLIINQVTNLSHPSYLTCEYERNMAFMANGKIYIWDCEETFWEIDPERFEY
jgi:hypothetical protein